MAVDAGLSIQASNSLGKKFAHQLAATHKQIMELMGAVSCQQNDDVLSMAVYQQACWHCTRCGTTGSNALWCNTSTSAKEIKQLPETLSKTVVGKWNPNLVCPPAKEVPSLAGLAC